MAAATKKNDGEGTGQGAAAILGRIRNAQLKSNVPEFRPGDTVRVHARIIEGSKERIQVFEGVVIKRHAGNGASATFTVRKVSYNIGVERTFFLHSPRVDKIEVVSRGEVRRARLFYLRDLRGKAARIKSQVQDGATAPSTEPTDSEEASSFSEETENRQAAQ